jgi:putative transcriptional regulator
MQYLFKNFCSLNNIYDIIIETLTVIVYNNIRGDLFMKSRLNTYLSFYNLSQAELAEATNINRNTIGRYCNDTFERIDKSHIDALCSFFRVSFESLFEIDYNFPIKYPSPVVKQSIKNLPVPKNLVITTGVNLRTMQEEIITYVKPDESENPMDKMTPEEIEEINQISSEYQRRFDLELKLDGLVSKFIDTILDELFLTLNFEQSTKQIFEKYKGYDYFTTNLKVEKFYDTFYKFLIHSSDKKTDSFIKVIDDIKSIYSNGGLGKLTDDDLDKLQKNIEIFIDNNISKKD